MDYAALPPTVESLARILEHLRTPDGCPWDREQTRETLSRHLAEECAEFLDAVDGNRIPELVDELGDLLMNVVFQTVVAAERGEFTLEEVVRQVNAKLIRRHPHVFGDQKVDSADQVLTVWEKVKTEQEHRVRESLLDGIPASLSALNQAEKIQHRVARVGFDWPELKGILAKVREELDEFEAELDAGTPERADEELGDLLFAVSNLARFRGRATSEELLRRANRKFQRRFRRVEQLLHAEGISAAEAGTDRLEARWQQAKAEEDHAAEAGR